MTVVAELVARLRADASQFKSEMKGATSTLGDTAKRMDTTGKNMSRKVTVPLLAVGAAAVKSFNDFDQSFAQIEGLVGASAEDLKLMRDAATDLAGETAKAPGELADALFFLQSAGLDAKDSVEALDMAAKASAAGLGDTATIADLTSSALNAYGSDVLNATQATDDLTAAVRLGKLAPSELAGSMGRVLPIASAMGVEFNEVAAAMAAMSRTGTNANEGATQLRGIMNGLLSPSKDAKNILEALHKDGLGGIQKMLRDDGLLVTLQFLVDSLGGNAAAAEQVFGNIRALSGVMDMLGSNVAVTEQIFDEMTDTVGSTDKAFEAVEKTAGHKMRQAFVDVQVALVAMGDVIIPVVASFASGFATIVSWVGKLPKPVLSVVAVFAGLVAAAGPVLIITAKLIKAWQVLQGTMVGGKIASAFASMLAASGGTATAMIAQAAAVAAAWAAIGLSIAAVVIVVKDELAKGKAQVAGVMDGVAQSFEANSGTFRAYRDQLLKTQGDLAMVKRKGDEAINPLLKKRYRDLEKELRATADGAQGLMANTARLKTSLGLSNDEAFRMAQTFADGERDVDAFALAAGRLRSEFGLVGSEAATLQEAIEAQGFTFADAKGAVALLQEQYGMTEPEAAAFLATEKNLTDVMAGNTSAVVANVDAVEQAKLPIGDLITAHQGLEEALKGTEAAFEALIGIAMGSIEAEIAMIESTNDVRDAVLEAGKAGEAGARSFDINTKAGRANAKNFNSAVRDIFAHANALLKDGVAHDEVTRKTNASIESLKREARAAGISEDKIDAYIATLNLTPDAVDTVIRTNANAVQHEAGAMNDALNWASRPRQVTFDVKLFGASAALARLDALSRKTGSNPLLNASIAARERRMPERRVGGPIPGARNEPFPVTAHGGEFVLSADVVDAIKRGQPTLGRGLGQPTLPMTGGNGGGGVVINEYVTIRTNSDPAAIAAVLERRQKANGTINVPTRRTRR